MRILRIETPSGEGPYCVGDWEFNELVSCRVRHPMPEADSKIANVWNVMTSREQYEWFFAFKDHAQYRAWFYSDEMLTIMHALGLGLAEYDVCALDVVLGNAQCIFRRKDAVKISHKSLVSTDA